MKVHHLIAAGLLIIALPATAADIAREIRTPSQGSDAFAELGIVLGTGKLPLIGFNGENLEDSADPSNYLSLGLLGRFEFKNLFAEFIENSFSNATLGATVYTGQHSELDIIVTSMFGHISRNEYSALQTIEDRSTDINAGVRGSYYAGESILQFELIHDIADSHNGTIASLQFGYQKQIRNWNLHSLIGMRYFSRNVIDHLFSVSATESTAEFPAYQPTDGFMPTIQVGAALPLSERWVFRTQAEYSALPDSVVRSPLAQGDNIYSAQMGVYYVFGGR